MILPLPSSPHWAPNTQVAGIVIGSLLPKGSCRPRREGREQDVATEGPHFAALSLRRRSPRKVPRDAPRTTYEGRVNGVARAPRGRRERFAAAESSLPKPPPPGVSSSNRSPVASVRLV